MEVFTFYNKENRNIKTNMKKRILSQNLHSTIGFSFWGEWSLPPPPLYHSPRKVEERDKSLLQKSGITLLECENYPKTDHYRPTHHFRGNNSKPLSPGMFWFFPLILLNEKPAYSKCKLRCTMQTNLRTIVHLFFEPWLPVTACSPCKQAFP